MGRNDRRHRFVGIRAQRVREILQRVNRRLQDGLGIEVVFRRVQHAHPHRAVRAIPGFGQRLGVTFVRRPGEVMHVALHIARGHLAVALDRFAGQLAGGANGIALGHGQAHVVIAEIGIELAVQVEFVRVPARCGGAAFAGKLEYGDLREPLADQMEAAVIAGARDHARQLVEELDVQRGGRARCHRLRQVDADHAAVGRRAAIGLHEVPFRGRAALLHLVQADVAVLAILGLDVAAEAARAGALLGHEGAARAFKPVEVHVQVDAAHRLRAAVAPAQDLLAGDRVLDRVQGGVDGVIDDAVGQGRVLAGASAAPGIGAAGDLDRCGIGPGQHDRGTRRRNHDLLRGRMRQRGIQGRGGEQHGDNTRQMHGQHSSRMATQRRQECESAALLARCGRSWVRADALRRGKSGACVSPRPARTPPACPDQMPMFRPLRAACVRSPHWVRRPRSRACPGH